jgi:hypothetical protein
MPSFFKKHKAEKTGKEVDKAAGTGKPDGNAQTDTAAADAIHPTASDASRPAPLLDDDEQAFLERLISKDDDDDDGPPPPLPPRPRTPDLTWDSDSDSFRAPKTEEPTTSTTTATATAPKKQNRLTRLFNRKPSSSTTLTVPTASTTVPPEEADREWADLNRVLSNLGIEPEPTNPSDPSDPSKPAAPSKTKAAAITASAEIQSLLRQFVVILKDIQHGAPTAVDDLVQLLDGRNDVLKRGFEKLPGSMQRLVTQLPKKLTSSLGPEVLAAAAQAGGVKGETDAKGLARFLMPKNLNDLLLTPAIVKTMLKAIVNALKVRWPAFVGLNVLWSVAVFLLLFVLWYFHKRGKEERERLEKEGLEGEEREMQEVDDEMSSAVVVVDPPAESPRP